MEKSPLRVDGMQGMGDNIHQRAILRQLMERHEVWLTSPWYSLYHDLIDQGLHVNVRQTGLRTQAKNLMRERNLFDQSTPPRGAPLIRPAYSGRECALTTNVSGSILEVMCRRCNVDFNRADYRLPIPDEWRERCHHFFTTNKPICVYRPLTVRPEWRGGSMRNADPVQYAELFNVIRDRYFVISVADLQPGKEWSIVTGAVRPDLQLHNGEFTFEELAGLYAEADIVYTSSGHGVALASAVETPVISVIGGYERARAHSHAAKFSPYIGIEPITPCNCSVSSCYRQCSKKLDMDLATGMVLGFSNQLGHEYAAVA